MILASGSPRRRDLLDAHGYQFEVVTADVIETHPDFFTPAEMTLYHARHKAAPVVRSHANSVVLAADTLVSLEGNVLGKPVDMEDARRMVRLLSGREHQVFSGVWIQRLNKAFAFVEVSHVTFRDLSEDEIEEYLSIVEPLDKAGAYAAQENVMDVIQNIDGSVTNVIGLPMERTEEVLEEAGIHRSATAV